MKYNKFDILKPVTAAIGFGLAVAASPASATITFGNPFTLFEDDNVDFLIDINDGTNPNSQVGRVDMGDIFVSIAEVSTASGFPIGPNQELTAVSILEILQVNANLNGTADDVIFGPVPGFTIPNYPPFSPFPFLPFTPPDTAPNLYPGAMIAFYLDPTPNLEIGAGSIVNGMPSCTTLDLCLRQATDGVLWQVDGFDGGTRGAIDPDEYFIALDAQTNTGQVDTADPSISFGLFNAGLSILFEDTGQNIVNDMLDCSAVAALTAVDPVCSAGNGMVDFLGSGSINGGGELFITSEWFATSDFDFTKKRSVPEPGTLVLMVTGLLGVGASIRIRRRG